MQKVLIIAEAGVNHNGDIGLAKELIRSAKDCGADIVKFQTWVTEELVDAAAPKAAYQEENDKESTSQYEMLKRLELPYDAFRELKAYAQETGIRFLSTPDEPRSLDFLVDELDMDLIKVGSGEVTNLPYLEMIGRKKKPVILSTGMSYLGEVEQAYYALVNAGAPEVTLLHCTSNYPAPFDSVNLHAMTTLQQAFKVPVGYSDHTMGNEVSFAAVALGAVVIEKHFTLDKAMAGPDHVASMNPQELRELVAGIRNIEQALAGNGIKRPQPDEIETRIVVRKGIYTGAALAAGQIIKAEDLKYKRPVGDGIDASMAHLLIGRKARHQLDAAQLVTLNDIQ